MEVWIAARNEPSGRDTSVPIRLKEIAIFTGRMINGLFLFAPSCGQQLKRVHPFIPKKSGNALGICPSHPSLRGKGDAGRCEAAGSKKPEAYSLEYVEDVFGSRTTQMPVDRLPQ